jgi:hypothetical protein
MCTKSVLVFLPVCMPLMTHIIPHLTVEVHAELDDTHYLEPSCPVDYDSILKHATIISILQHNSLNNYYRLPNASSQAKTEDTGQA